MTPAKNRHIAKRGTKSVARATSIITGEETERARPSRAGTTSRRAPAKAAKRNISEHPESAEPTHAAGEREVRAHAGATPQQRSLERASDQSGKSQTFEGDLDVLMALAPGRRAPARRAMEQIGHILVQSTQLPDAGETATFEQRVQTAVDTLRVITLGDSRRVQTVIDALEPLPPEDAENVDLQEAEARGRLRLQALYRKIVTDSYSVADLRAEWGITRQRLAQLRQADRLFAVSIPFHRSMLYPRWQFEASHRPRPIMPNLIKEARSAGLDAIGFHQLMSNPASGSGTSPVQMLDLGQEELVLGIIRASGP
jgi:hypothetical protein